MATTEARLNQLFNRATDVLGPAEAETMMEIMRSSLRGDLATTSDLHALERRMDGRFSATAADLHALEQRMDGRFSATTADLHAMEQRMTKTFVTWMLASQAAFTTVVAVFFTVAT